VAEEEDRVTADAFDGGRREKRRGGRNLGNHGKVRADPGHGKEHGVSQETTFMAASFQAAHRLRVTRRRKVGGKIIFILKASKNDIISYVIDR
jgi:hypothetical protein